MKVKNSLSTGLDKWGAVQDPAPGLPKTQQEDIITL